MHDAKLAGEHERKTVLGAKENLAVLCLGRKMDSRLPLLQCHENVAVEVVSLPLQSKPVHGAFTGMLLEMF